MHDLQISGSNPTAHVTTVSNGELERPMVQKTVSSGSAVPLDSRQDSDLRHDNKLQRNRLVARKQADEQSYKQYRRLMDDLVNEVRNASDYLDDKGQFTDEGSSITVEVDELLRRLSECRWGESEKLRLVATVLRIPTRNARWTRNHVEFLQEILPLLRVQYLIDESTVRMCKDALRAHGLDIFRGSVTEPEVVRRYKLVEVVPNE